MEQTTTQSTTIKSKVFKYHTSVKWKSGKQGEVSSNGKPIIEMSSPPEFKGIEGYWTPEDLFVASIEYCQLATFLALCERKQLPLKTYSSSAEGVLENIDGKYRFSTVTISPVITVAQGWTQEQVEQLLHRAHEHCLIANSTTTNVVIKPTINFE